MSEDRMWIAEFESTNTRARGFGHSPEEAVSSLATIWRDRWAAMSGADPDYLFEYRDDIVVSALEPGKAYLIGVSDALWHEEVLTGSDSRFDSALASPTASPSR